MQRTKGISTSEETRSWGALGTLEKQGREQLDLTQGEVAGRVGLDTSGQISRLENQKGRVKPEVLQAIFRLVAGGLDEATRTEFVQLATSLDIFFDDIGPGKELRLAAPLYAAMTARFSDRAPKSFPNLKDPWRMLLEEGQRLTCQLQFELARVLELDALGQAPSPETRAMVLSALADVSWGLNDVQGAFLATESALRELAVLGLGHLGPEGTEPIDVYSEIVVPLNGNDTTIEVVLELLRMRVSLSSVAEDYTRMDVELRTLKELSRILGNDGMLRESLGEEARLLREQATRLRMGGVSWRASLSDARATTRLRRAQAILQAARRENLTFRPDRLRAGDDARNLMTVLRLLGQVTDAEQLYKESLRLFGDHPSVINLLFDEATWEIARGSHQRAEHLLREVAFRAVPIQSVDMLARALASLGYLYAVSRGRPDDRRLGLDCLMAALRCWPIGIKPREKRRVLKLYNDLREELMPKVETSQKAIGLFLRENENRFPFYLLTGMHNLPSEANFEAVSLVSVGSSPIIDARSSDGGDFGFSRRGSVV